MVIAHTFRRAVSAGAALAALMIVGVALPAGAAQASTPSPWDGIARCESGGDWSIDTGNGYFGGLQFSAATWRAHGGRGSAATASRAEQIRIGRRVVVSQGWEAWSSCSARLGLHGHALPADPRSGHRRAEQGHHGGRTASTRVPACTAETLRARFVAGASAAGIRRADLELINTGAHRCRLDAAPRPVSLSAERDGDQVGDGDLGTRFTTAAVARTRLVLRAHGGRAYSRVAIAAVGDHGARCRPGGTALVTVLRDRSHPVRASLRGLRLPTCGVDERTSLSFGRYRPHRLGVHGSPSPR